MQRFTVLHGVGCARSPNCKARIVEVNRRRRVFYFAASDLAPGEELTCDTLCS